MIHRAWMHIDLLEVAFGPTIGLDLPSGSITVYHCGVDVTTCCCLVWLETL